MAPSKPVRQLSYISPVQPDDISVSLPFELRHDFVFFGYNNFANNQAVDWFHKEVLPLIETGHKFHIAGLILTSICKCEKQSSCVSLRKNVVCHCVLEDDELEKLVQKARVAVNPVLEPLGIATET